MAKKFFYSSLQVIRKKVGLATTTSKRWEQLAKIPEKKFASYTYLELNRTVILSNATDKAPGEVR